MKVDLITISAMIADYAACADVKPPEVTLTFNTLRDREHFAAQVQQDMQPHVMFAYEPDVRGWNETRTMKINGISFKLVSANTDYQYRGYP